MEFKREDWTLFRTLGTLGQKAGVPRERLAALVVKELADNALDAGATCNVARGAAPGIYLISDDGPGIPGTDEQIASLFSIRRPLTSSKLVRLPTRGALGNGLRVVTGAILASGGDLYVTTRGRRLHLTPQDDGSTLVERIHAKAPEQGTQIEIRFGPELAKQDALDLAELAITMRGETRYEGLSSPHWYDSDAFYEMFHAAEGATVADILCTLHGGDRAKLTPERANESASYLTRVDTDRILGTLRGALKAPPATKLGAVGEAAFACQGYSRKTAEMTLPAARGAHSAVIPVVIECWATKLPEGERPRTRFFVNRTPIAATVSCGKKGTGGEMWVNGCGINNYFKTGRAPMRLYLCVTAPYMPVTTDGKEPNLSPIVEDIEAAITAATRKAKTLTATGRVGATQADTVIEVLDEAVRVASGDKTHRYSLRQLFYATRPLLASEGFEGELSYGYFATIVGNHEAANGRDMPGMYRDARGTLQHPHEAGQMALGTLNVERYKRPEYRFNKVLYIEKGGFFPLLADAKWAERHDCALLTSQGMASRAARDLLDLLGDTNEPLEFFVIHDADGPGTIIYEALVEGTKARPGRRVTVTNLGLEPWEAKAMGLEAERVERKKGAVPVAEYIRRYDRANFTDWEEWLQGNRYELNAMTSPVFLDWLDRKMEDHSKNTKVIPPPVKLAELYRSKARATIRDRLIEDAIRTLGIDEAADRLLATLDTPPDLDKRVLRRLRQSPEAPWEKPLEALAVEAGRSVFE